MFRTTNPYDELIIKATDEKLTSEDWGLNLELCDKVTEDKEAGARNATSALQKRLAHRNPNVQLFALELTNTLSENCGSYIHQEIASKSFTEGLERVVTDRTTNDRVRKKVLHLIKKWTETFESDPDLGIMGDLYERLKKNNEYYSVLTQSSLNEAPPDDEIARTRAAAEEEEMQRAIELSKQDKGGRGTYASASNAAQQQQSSSSSSSAANNNRSHSPSRSSQAQAALPPIPRPVTPSLDQATRVRALYAYTPTNPTELSFNEGDVIKVIGRTYDQWWRGTLRGRVGIFPVNYIAVEKEPSEEELRREREEEDEVFQGVARFDELLERLRGVDVARGDRVEDSREIEELYATCIGMQSKIANLIAKYAGQKADLEQISNIFNEASHQYQLMKNPQAPPPQAYAQPTPHHLPPQAAYEQQQQQQPPQHQQQQQQPPQQQQQQQQHRPQSSASPQPQPQPQSAQMSPEWQAYYAQQAAQAQGQAPSLVPGQQVNPNGPQPGQSWPGQPPVQGGAPPGPAASGGQSPAYDPYAQPQQQHPHHQQQQQHQQPPPLHSQPSYNDQQQQQPPQHSPSNLPTTIVTQPTITRGSQDGQQQQQPPYGSQDGHEQRARPGSWVERAGSSGGYAIAAQYHQQTQAQQQAQQQQHAGGYPGAPSQ